MDHQVRTLVEQEDRRRPMTDDELAGRLGLRRDQVTVIRQRLAIPDSRERRRQAVIQAIAHLGAADRSDRELTRLLQTQGFDVSRQVVAQCRKEAGRPPQSRPSAPVQPRSAVETSPAPPPSYPAPRPAKSGQAFVRLVGAAGSLRPVIEQVRASVLYPPHGLHTLILGPTGVGKSELAKAMYEFARESGRMGPASRFVAFNCADYAENPQLLVSQLFGVAKGAYTGANTERAGLVEQADGGMLFLDEVHRLPPDGQEILYYLIDHGSFRRLGETEAGRKVSVMIVAATTEEVDSTLLLPFRRRIPMVVRLPGLAERPLAERLEYIETVLAEEATRVGMPIRASADAVKAFLLYDCPGNLGGLRSDVQVACARSFVESVTHQTAGLTVGVAQLPPHVARGLLRTDVSRHELGGLVLGNLDLTPGARTFRHLVKDAYAMPRDTYEYVERRHQELLREGMAGAELSQALGAELESRLQAFVNGVRTAPLAAARKELGAMVGEQVVKAAARMVEVASTLLDTVDDRLLYCLATHLAAALERIRDGRPVVSPQIPPSKRGDREMAVASQMVAAAEAELGLTLPAEESAYVALYLRSFSGVGPAEARVGIVVVSHGKVATAMTDVAHRLLGVNHAKAVEMMLDEPPATALERARQAVVEADEGRGVLLLADMGSLVSFGPLISESTGIPTRTVERVDITVVLDAIRRALLPGAGLDEVAAALPGLKPPVPVARTDRPRAVLAACITGQGAARRIRDMIQEALPGMQVLTEGLIAAENLSHLTEQFDLVATVGTVNPGLGGVPFIPFQEMLHGSGATRLRLLAGQPSARPAPVRLADVVEEALLLPGVKAANKTEVLKRLAGLLTQAGYVRSDFYEGVLEREQMGPSLLAERVAIPHADPTRVRRAGIAVAVLESPIPWGEGFLVDVVFMAALTAESGPLVLELNDLTRNPERLRRLRHALTKQEMTEVFVP